MQHCLFVCLFRIKVSCEKKQYSSPGLLNFLKKIYIRIKVSCKRSSTLFQGVVQSIKEDICAYLSQVIINIVHTKFTRFFLDKTKPMKDNGNREETFQYACLFVKGCALIINQSVSQSASQSQ